MFHLDLEDFPTFASSTGYKSVRRFKPGDHVRYLIVDVGQVAWDPEIDGSRYSNDDKDFKEHLWGGKTIEMDPQTWPRLKMLLDMPKLREIHMYIPNTWQKNEILHLAPTIIALMKRGVLVRLTKGSGESPDEGMEDDMGKPVEPDFQHAAACYKEQMMVASVYRVLILAPERFADLLKRERDGREFADDTSDEDDDIFE
ncbi:uncharacterized protein BDZ99DRAFT_525443 [Mytilinidion resinicola]|uniref:Uncharacterized protein n=1 Tax=Mytilinidion resinicola TaxID=574789 RepID=A0A6A6Y725_9PEZI|nr:uncharacterized protein BDZ99DRAFT_525443 [Mytilinidion resinicola]KAF2804612.1 hypothetical protein BDZ99DRAFT_525443 [Mytilinidion resinicola]